MIIACLSDLHLGYRAYAATTTKGRNLRERDVEGAWRACVDEIAALEDLDFVLIAGDIFHHPRVSDFARNAFLGGLRDILYSHDSAHCVVLQGNHDAARTAEVLSPIELARFAEPFRDRVSVVTEPRVLYLPRPDDGAVAIHCLPFSARQREDKVFRLTPDPDAETNILLVHAPVQGDRIAKFYAGEHALDVGKLAVTFDAVVCGDYHEHTVLSTVGCAFYCGAIERTTSNVWGESDRKGWVILDVDARAFQHRTVPVRPVNSVELVENEPIDTAEKVNQVVDLLLGALSVNGTGPVLRVVAKDFPRAERDLIDWKAVRALKKEAAHFQLDISYAAAEEASFTRGSGRSIAERAAEALEGEPAEVRELALGYIREAS